MDKHKFLVAIALFLFVILGSTFISAAMAGALINISSIQRYQNFSTTINFTVITTMINHSATTDSNYNATLFCNKSGGAVTKSEADVGVIKIATLYNGTHGNTSAGAGLAILSNSSIRISNIVLPGNESSTMNCSVWAENISGGNWTSGLDGLNLSNLTFDSTPPNVSFSGITNTIKYGNYSGGLLIINVSVIDPVMGIDRVYFNLTFSNGTQTNWTRAINSGNYFNITINTTNFQDGTYNLTVYANDTFTIQSTAVDGAATGTNLNKTEQIYFTLDNTAPYELNFTSTTINYGNYSSTIIINVSSLDATSGIGSLFFNITNSSSKQNGTYTASKAGNYWSVSLNTASFADGRYNITAWVNDSSGNQNKTALVYNITLDNTAPTGSLSCTPATVNTGNTVTCSCSASDATSGVNSSATSVTTNPSTSNTGTFTQSCSFADMAGKTGSASTTYIVELGASSSGGASASSASSFWTKGTTSVSDALFEQGYTKQIIVKQRLKVQVSGEDHYVGAREITNTTATIEISSDPVQVKLEVGEDVKVDVTNDGFYDIYVKLNAITNNKADITVQKINEEIPEGEESVATTGGEIISQEPSAEEPEEETNLMWLWIVLGVVILAIIIGAVVKKKK